MKNFEKLSLSKIENNLSKSEMKMIMAGSGDSGTCQEHTKVCTTAGKLNCCSGMICADYRCVYQTFA